MNRLNRFVGYILDYIKNIFIAMYQVILSILGKHKPSSTGAWLWNILYSIDTLLNAILAGDPQETVSSRFGKILNLVGSGHIRKTDIRYKVAKVVCKLLHPLEANHCKVSINTKEGRDELSDEFQRLIFMILFIILVGGIFYIL